MLIELAMMLQAGSAISDQVQAPPLRYSEMARKIAEMKVARIGCRPRDIILDERAFNLFSANAKDKAFWEGIGEGEAVSIANAAEQVEKKHVDDGGGDLVKVAGSSAAMTRYNEYWRSRCEVWTHDPFMSKFFVRRADLKSDAPSYPTPPSTGGMCYKDYCPCQGKQNALDKMLCDSLEEGLPVDISTMITGRALRAAQQDIRDGGRM